MVEWGVDEVKVVVDRGILVDEAEDQVEEEEENLDQPILIHWRVIGAGCMAIWPVTVPNPKASREEVAQVALPEELFLNPGKKAHREDVDVVGKSDSRASTSCTTMREILTPSTMQGSCMCPWILDRLLLSLLRWKWRKTQKTKKDLCECGRWRCHIVFSSHWSIQRKKKFEGML